MILSGKLLSKLVSSSIEELPNYQVATKAYLSKVFTELEKQDYSKESLTLIYAQAKFTLSLPLFQSLADWILFIKTIYPEALHDASEDYYNALAQNSYFWCYKILHKQWKLYEELADQFPKIVNELRSKLLPELDQTQIIYSSWVELV